MLTKEEKLEMCLSRDLAKAAKTLRPDEVRFLVDAYYIIQEDRKRTGNQGLALDKSGEPHAVLSWFYERNKILEAQLKRALDVYSNGDPLGQWAREVHGIGPVIAAGLLAHIDLDIAKSVSSIWRYAGLDPTSIWEKGEKRPWNATLKVLCWKIGESFLKQSGNEDCFYGKLLLQRLEQERQKNRAGLFEERAKEILTNKTFGRDTDAFAWYSGQFPATILDGWHELDTEERRKRMTELRMKPGEGDHLLPPAHILAMAKRYAVKIFLSHYFEKGCKLSGKIAPQPYVIAHKGHVHKIDAPN